MTMRALNYEDYGGIDTMQIGETPVPEIADDEILIRVHAASINPFDWKLRNGMLRNFFDVEFPITPGRDGCGEIVSLGKSAEQDDHNALQPGQRVSFISSRMQHGALAEFAAVKALDFVTPAPPDMTDQQCAALPLVGLSAWNALVDTAELQPGMQVLIHGGAGGVGSVAIQIARHIGAEVYATCSRANIGTVEDLGAIAIPYDSVDFTKAVSDCDVVLDTVGGEVHEKSYTVLKKGGCLVYLIAKPFTDVSAKFNVETRQAIILNRTENLRQVMDLATSGILSPKVSRSLPLAEFKEAFQLVESGKAGGKVVLELGVGPA